LRRGKINSLAQRFGMHPRLLPGPRATFFFGMTQLRDYQVQFKDRIRSALGEHKKIIACSATGSGKTKTFLNIADHATSKGTTVLVLTEARKIFNQIAKERPDAVEIKSTVRYADIILGTLYVAMAQTLAKRPFIVSQLQNLRSKLLIINDEAHIGTATKLLEQLPDAYLIGFTATPDYKVAKHLPKLYREIVVGPQPQELVELGFLSPYYHYESKAASLTDLKQKNGEFTEESQFAAFSKPTVFAGLHKDLSNHTFRKVIIFCSSISHCSKLTAELRGQGYKCAEVHSNNQQSDAELALFMYGQTPICVSVGILTKGFDFPEIDLVILQRATTSLALYCQMVGRGSRVTPTKTKFTVLDYGGNASRHGLWNFEHDWAEKWNRPPKRKKDGVSPVKECPKCFLLVSPTVKICPECGHIFEPTKKELEEGEMIHVTAEYDKIRGKRIADLTPKELALYAKFTNKKPFAARVAKAKGKEYCTEYAKEMNYSPFWAARHNYSEHIEFYNALIK